MLVLCQWTLFFHFTVTEHLQGTRDDMDSKMKTSRSYLLCGVPFLVPVSSPEEMPISGSHWNANDLPEASKPQGLALIPQSPEPATLLGRRDLQDLGRVGSKRSYLAQLQNTSKIVPGAIDQGQWLRSTLHHLPALLFQCPNCLSNPYQILVT